ncbi:MAG: methionyl-tRNA formyltransferase [Gemmatimonadota bacterium]
MRVVFWGSPEFAVATLDALLASAHEVVAVLTQPPKPKGRGRTVEATPVQRRAEAAGIPVLAPRKPRGAEFIAALQVLEPDVFVVAAYGAILPPEVLVIPPRGAINVHASLLPDLRGAAPITRAILEGRDETGATIMRMDEGLDTGPTLLQARTLILPDDTAGTLTERIAAIGADLLVAALDRLAAGTIEERPQNHSAATYAEKVNAEEARLDWRRPAEELERATRAYDPWPGASTTWRGERLKVFRLVLVHDTGSEPGQVPATEPGTIVAMDPEPIVRAGDGLVRLREVQPAAGRRMAADAWARGRGVAPGDRLGA